MLKKTILLSVSIFLLFFPLIINSSVFAASAASEYLCGFAMQFYRIGRYEDALSEFKKVLLIDPENETAREYINNIFQKESTSTEEIFFLKKPITRGEAKQQLTRKEIINNTLNGLTKGKPGEKGKETAAQNGPAVLSGEYRLSLGFTPQDVIWKDANADQIGVPREKNWRYLWGEKRHNTYDPKIYDRLRVDMKTNFDNPLNAFMEITIDPWTFVGKNHVTVTSTVGGDAVDMDLKYWSADSRIINEVYRSKKGNIINLKQIKVDDGKTTITTPTGLTDWGTAFNSIQPMKVNRDYRPIRKLWFDYKQEDYSLKVFPISDQFEALTSDDPLKLSNNHVYWEEGPWLDEYEPSRIFTPDSGLTPIKRGRWIRRLSFFTRDSSDDYPHRLTFLRGATFKSDTGAYSLEATAATPVSLWGKYENSNSVNGAVRLKVPLKDASLGLTTTSKLGLNGGSMEALNQVEGIDLSYKFKENNTLYGTAAYSYTGIEEAKGFNTTYDGVGAKLGFAYDASEAKTQGIYKNELSVTYMGHSFYPALSNYRYTRRDEPTLSRHIYFADIQDYDKALIWGDGIDRGRLVFGLKLNLKAFDEKLDSDIKYRNVHNIAPGKYVESVLRTESTYKVNSRLTSKILAYYQNLHKTRANEDPILYQKTMYSLSDYFSDEDLHPQNTSVVDGKDPSIGVFGLGLKCDVVEKIFSVEGVYERTNDPQDFPRSLLNDTFVTTEELNGYTYDKVVPFVYDQKFFDLPPFSYYNIAKTKFIYMPRKEWEFILGYTFNENNHATGIDDNINHIALETKYIPIDKWTFWLKYIYSGVVDVYKQNKQQRSDFFDWHHNVFFGSEYKLDPDASFTLLYGEFVGYDDPYEQANWTLSSLDTQHIFRMFYRRKF